MECPALALIVAISFGRLTPYQPYPDQRWTLADHFVDLQLQVAGAVVALELQAVRPAVNVPQGTLPDAVLVVIKEDQGLVGLRVVKRRIRYEVVLVLAVRGVTSVELSGSGAPAACWGRGPAYATLCGFGSFASRSS